MFSGLINTFLAPEKAPRGSVFVAFQYTCDKIPIQAKGFVEFFLFSFLVILLINDMWGWWVSVWIEARASVLQEADLINYMISFIRINKPQTMKAIETLRKKLCRLNNRQAKR